MNLDGMRVALENAVSVPAKKQPQGAKNFLRTLCLGAKLRYKERREREKVESHAKWSSYGVRKRWAAKSEVENPSKMEAVEYTGPFMYISTVSSLIYDPFKVKIEPGFYSVKMHRDGCVFTKNAQLPELEDIVKILNDRDGDLGFYGTYHDGGTDNYDIVRMVYNNFLPNFTGDYREHFLDCIDNCYCYDDDDDYYVYEDDDTDDTDDDDDDESDYEYIPLKEIPDYNNIPVMFYLNTQLNVHDLKNLRLSEHHDFGNDFLVWKVSHPLHGILGVAVQQPYFINMMGDQMGLAIFGDMKRAEKLENFAANGFGNIEIGYRELEDEEVVYPNFTSKFFEALK